MRKVIFLIAIIMFSITATAFATDEVDVVIPTFPVNLNGVEYSSEEAMYPLINYNGITYFPMTWNLGQSLGLSTSYTQENGLSINLGKSTGLLEYMKDDGNSLGGTYKAQLPSYQISVMGRVIDNSTEDYPILSFRDVTYFPLTWKYAVEEFQWDYNFTSETGLGIAAVVEASEPVTEEVVIEEISTMSDLETFEVSNSLNTIGEWKFDDGNIYMEINQNFNGDYRFNYGSELYDEINNDLEYNMFAFIIEFYKGNDLVMVLNDYENSYLRRYNAGGMYGRQLYLSAKDFDGVTKVTYRIQFVESSLGDAYFEDKMQPMIDLSKLVNFTSYVETIEETYTVDDVQNGEVIGKKELTYSQDIIPQSIVDEYNIEHMIGGNYANGGKPVSTSKALESIMDDFSLDLLSTFVWNGNTYNLVENNTNGKRRLYEKLGREFYFRISPQDDAKYLEILFDGNLQPVGYIEYN